MLYVAHLLANNFGIRKTIHFKSYNNLIVYYFMGRWLRSRISKQEVKTSRQLLWQDTTQQVETQILKRIIHV